MPRADGTAYATEQGKRYEEYISSSAWRLKRLEYWARYGRSCKVKDCGSTEHLEVHHHTYDRLGDELLTDLVGVCRVHHEEIHARYDALNRHASLTRITEEVVGIRLRLKPQKGQPKKPGRPKSVRPAAGRNSKKAIARSRQVGRHVGVLDTVGRREIERSLTPAKPRQPVLTLVKGQKKADERRKIADRRSALTRAHQQAQEVARRIAAARQK